MPERDQERAFGFLRTNDDFSRLAFVFVLSEQSRARIRTYIEGILIAAATHGVGRLAITCVVAVALLPSVCAGRRWCGAGLAARNVRPAANDSASGPCSR